MPDDTYSVNINMKLLCNAITLISFLLVTSCGKEDSLADSIIGQWEISKVDLRGNSNEESYTANFDDGCGDFLGESFCFTIDFKLDGNAILSNVENDVLDERIVAYTIDESARAIVTCVEECLEFTVDGTIMMNTRQLDGNTMVMTFIKDLD